MVCLVCTVTTAPMDSDGARYVSEYRYVYDTCLVTLACMACVSLYLR